MTPLRVVAASALVLAALPASPQVAHAEPAAPQQDSPCLELPAGTLAQLPDGAPLIQCRDGRWQPFTDVYPSSDNWLTYGPELTLHGQARRNPEIMAGSWTGTPQDPEKQCGATQYDVIAAGLMAPPQVLTGEPGQPLRLSLTTQLATITFSGNCLWHRES